MERWQKVVVACLTAAVAGFGLFSAGFAMGEREPFDANRRLLEQGQGLLRLPGVQVGQGQPRFRRYGGRRERTGLAAHRGGE